MNHLFLVSGQAGAWTWQHRQSTRFFHWTHAPMQRFHLETPESTLDRQDALHSSNPTRLGCLGKDMNLSGRAAWNRGETPTPPFQDKGHQRLPSWMLFQYARLDRIILRNLDNWDKDRIILRNLDNLNSLGQGSILQNEPWQGCATQEDGRAPDLHSSR